MNNVPKKILIIEDEKPLASALEIKLTHEGFVVVTVPSGDLAFPLIERGELSMIISDLVIPKIDGYKLLEFIKNKNIKIPVLILTNLSQIEDERKARELGASEYFVKANTSISQIMKFIKEKID